MNLRPTSPTYINISLCLIAILVQRRRSQSHKQRNSIMEAPYSISSRENRAHYRSSPCHPRGAGNFNSLTQWES